MKRMLCFAVLSILTAAAAYSATITVTSPKEGDTMKLGTKVIIEWTWTGIPNDQTYFSIRLMKDGQVLDFIHRPFPEPFTGPTGHWSWDVGTAFNNTYCGKGFQIMVSLGDIQAAPPIGTSGTFSIACPGLDRAFENFNFCELAKVVCPTCPLFDLNELIKIVSNPAPGWDWDEVGSLNFEIVCQGQVVASLGTFAKGGRSVAHQKLIEPEAAFRGRMKARSSFQLRISDAKGNVLLTKDFAVR